MAPVAAPVPPATSSAFDVEAVRRDFPILRREVHGRRLVYLDNAATTQKPEAVLQALDRYYREENANVHRGVHFLSEASTRAYEGARATAQRFLNAADAREIVFVRGTTEAVNLVAHSYGRSRVKAGDEILVTAMEHHSNIVPWQMLCRETGATLRVVPVTDEGELCLEEVERLLSERTRLVAVVHLSNALGTINPVREIVQAAHARSVPVLVDGAQAAPHLVIDVQDLDCDFYAFSGHKVYGPTGIGVLYGKAALLEAMPPYQGGGDMIRSVTFEETTYAAPPRRFEAGTPNVAGAVGLAAALEYVNALGREALAAHEAELLAYAAERVGAVPGVRRVGTARERAGVLSFVLQGVHPHDVATVLDREGVAIRAGHHCTQPLMCRLGIPATARASFACYNTLSEIDALAEGLDAVRRLFG
jgi:cysteine desulfurase/selenocysteine lyase